MTAAAIIGCGEIGGPVAQWLAGVADVIACDHDPSRRSELQDAGLRVTDSVAEIGPTEVVFVCVATEDQVLSVVRAMESDVPAIVILSTVSPNTMARVASIRPGAQVLDAPVSGGAHGARDGTLTVMVGGPSDAVERLRPLFAAFASHVVHCGARGTGQLTKIMNNVLCHTNTVLMAEVCALATAQGLDPVAMAHVMEVSTGRNTLTASPDRIAGFYNDFASNALRYEGLMQILRKDLGIAEEIAADSGGVYPAVAAMAEVMRSLGEETHRTWACVGA